MKKSYIIGLFCVLALFISNAFAVEVTLYGPKQFTREEGKPYVFTGTFPGRIGQGTLIVKSGTLESANRVSSAIIKINGQVICGTKDFNLEVYNMEIPLTLMESNTISVELRSEVGSYLWIEVREEVVAEAAGVVGINGGIVQVTDSSSPLFGVSLDIPPGAIYGPVVLSINEASYIPPLPAEFFAGENPIELQPSGLIFYEKAKLTIPSNGVTERMFFVYDEIEKLWESLETILDTDTNNFEIQIFHTSVYDWICHQASRAFLCTPFKPCTTVTFSINNFPSDVPGYSEAQIKENIENAVNSWEEALAGGLYFSKTEESNADIKFFWSNDLRFLIDESIVALRTVDPITGAQEIKLNDNLTWSAGYFDLDGIKWSIEAIALHEMGHALGLTHHCLYGLKECWGCVAYGPVMAPVPDNYQEPACIVLREDDISRIRELYGSGAIDDNPVPNPSFEDGTGIYPDGWRPMVPDWADFIWTDTISHSGRKSVEISNPRILEELPYGYVGWISDDFEIDSEKEYDFSVWFYWDGEPYSREDTTKCILCFYDENGGHKGLELWEIEVGEIGSWQNFKVVGISIPQGTKWMNIAVFRFYYEGSPDFSSTLWFDDVELIKK